MVLKILCLTYINNAVSYNIRQSAFYILDNSFILV